MKLVNLERVLEIVAAHEDLLLMASREIEESRLYAAKLSSSDFAAFLDGRVTAFASAAYRFQELLADLNELN
jgi:hypothetical protein